MTTEQTNINAASTQDPAAQPAQHPTDGAISGQSNGAKFTQEQVNEMVGKTRKEARETAIADLLKELGLTSKDEVKSTIVEARKRKESELSEAEKLQAERDKAAKERDDAIAERDRERTERRNDKIAAALSTAASKLQAKDTDDVLMHARDKHAEEFNALIDEAGAVSKEKLDALLEKIKVAKPHYFGDGKTVVQATVIPSNARGTANGTDSRVKQEGVQQLRRQIRSGF
jgi:small-conductance mechanosensitive channel